MRKTTLFALLLALAAPALAQPGRKSSSDAMPYRHTLSFTPFTALSSYAEFNPGVGFIYEYMFAPESGISFNLPMMIGFPGPEQSTAYINNQYYQHSVAFAAPGIRFHTGRRRSNVDFATGPALVIGNLRYRYSDEYNFNNQPQGPNYNYTMLGLAADNSINFYRNHFVFGFDLRAGTMLEEQNGTRFFFNFGMHFGGAF